MGGGYVLSQRLALAKELGQFGGAAAVSEDLWWARDMFFLAVKAHIEKKSTGFVIFLGELDAT